MGRTPCCDKANVKKGPWSPEEDAKLKDYIQKHGTGGNWISLPLKAGLKRCGKSCRLRWLNYLRPNIKHGDFSEEEDRIICNLYSTIGSRWSVIAAQLPERTDNDIKNYWNTKLKKKLMEINKNTIRRTSQKTSSTIINSSASSSISSSPSSYSDHHSNQLVMSSSSGSSFNGPFSTTLLDPISFSPNLLLNPTINNTNNNNATLFHHQLISPDQISFTMISTPPVMVGSAQNNYHDVKENDHNHTVLGFGGRDQGSCSSSDDAEYSGGGVMVEEEEIKRIRSMSFVNGWNNERQLEEQEMWMDYGLEEITQLISSSTSCSSNVFFYEATH